MNGEQARNLIFQINSTHMMFRKAMRHALKKNNAGITFEMLQVLSRLWDEQGVSQQRLAERTAKTKASLTSLMTNLERKGLVYREENPDDRRNKRVFLTPEGVAFRQVIYPIIFEVYCHMEEQMGLRGIERSRNDLSVLQDILEDFIR